MKALKITLNDWQKILIEIAKHHPRSVWMIRTNMRKVLGFTPREHEEWLGNYDEVNEQNRLSSQYGYKRTIHLDFYDESKRTMFLLKYSDLIKNENP